MRTRGRDIIYIDRDIPFCGGNCTSGDSTIPAAVEQRFGNSSDFKTVVIPHAGHGLNLVGYRRGARFAAEQSLIPG